MFKTKMKSLMLLSYGLLAMTVSATGIAQPGSPQDRYIVVLRDGAGPAADVAAEVAISAGGRVGYVYETVLNGFSISVPRAALRGIRSNPRVAYVEEDRPASIFAQEIPTGIDRILAVKTALGIDDNDDYRVDVDVAVVDTGIDWEHPDLNVVGGANCLQTTGGGPPWARNYYCDDSGTTSGDDDHYHGTHVAGTIGALDNGIGVVGVAPGARLYAVKVLDSGGSGYTSGIIAGIDWVVDQGDIEVLNMSLGGSGVDESYRTAIDNAVSKGVVVVVAAGNSDADANDYSPAYVPSAITVSALADFNGAPGGGATPTCRSDVDDTLADFSNWGDAIDMAAPGVCILSTYPLEKGEYNSISGTSKAAPHVAGAAALLASGGASPTNSAEVTAIRDALISKGNFDWEDDSPDNIQEPLLDISDTSFAPTLVATDGGGDGGGGTSNTPPTASFSHSCTDLACTFDAGGSSDADGDTLSYSWDFGDGKSGSGVTASHTYPADGNYIVTLTVSDGTDSDIATDTVSVTDTSGGGGGGGDTGTFTTDSTSQGRNWTAIVRSDAPFSGVWSNGSGCSDKTECSLSGIRKKVGSVTFKVTDGPELVIYKP